MDLSQLKQKIEEIEEELRQHPFLLLHTFRAERDLHLAITERLRRSARKGRVWKSRRFLSPLKNAAYGFIDQRARSRGGADGIFLMDRTYRPPNEMMKKLFDRYLDHPDRGAGDVAAALGVAVAELLPVRLVSHHMRLLGVLARGDGTDTLVLVDYDDTK